GRESARTSGGRCHPSDREGGWNRGRSIQHRPLVLSRTRGRFDSRRLIVVVEDQADQGSGQPGQPAVAEPEDEVLEAPERGSVEELLDAGAHDPIDAMRHSTAHVMAEAVLDLFPVAK